MIRDCSADNPLHWDRAKSTRQPSPAGPVFHIPANLTWESPFSGNWRRSIVYEWIRVESVCGFSGFSGTEGTPQCPRHPMDMCVTLVRGRGLLSIHPFCHNPYCSTAVNRAIQAEQGVQKTGNRITSSDCSLYADRCRGNVETGKRGEKRTATASDAQKPNRTKCRRGSHKSRPSFEKRLKGPTRCQ